jgi:AAA+ superfamily predicted ATPase
MLYINSFEEHGVDEKIQKAAGGRRILEWNGVGGFSDFKTKASYEMKDATLTGTLRFLLAGEELDGTLLVLKDTQSMMEDAEAVALLKCIAEKISTGEVECTVIFVSSVWNMPKELEPYLIILELDYLGKEEIRGIIDEFISQYAPLQGTDADILEEMAVAFKGLSRFEIENILALAYANDGELKRDDLELIFEQKQQVIMKSGILEMIPLKEKVEDIGGLENLKQWLNRKAKILRNVDRASAFGVDVPKGVLLAGVPGCGKSLNAKAAANLFGVPLLRLDMGRLMGKYIGESEGNLRKAIKQAEAIAPCVLWVDELEKAFAGIGGVGGGSDVTTRLFGNFLTWMQEKESPVFVVATANDIMKLPPELLRKGRFDEIFYIGLPNRAERKKIFEIHIAKRRRGDLKNINLDRLVEKTEGYSGADIEGVVKESMETAYVRNQPSVTTEDILEAIRNTHSLSEIMKEPLELMTKEYKNRKFKNASAEA